MYSGALATLYSFLLLWNLLWGIQGRLRTRTTTPPVHRTFDRRYDTQYTRWRGLQSRCGCNRSGSRDSRCDIVTGQCSCWPHVTARTCDRCEMGYFLLKSGVGCEKCDCDLMGSLDGSCDQSSGQCLCKSGVGGKRCDSCKFGFFDFSEQGCRACDPCDKPGHICDPDTGRCVCPTMTQGGKCEMCRNNAYGYHPNHGCKPCNCAPQGSIGGSCDPVTGQCRCREGYIGLRCEKCAHGFFDFPSCKSCRCKVEGTDSQACDDKGVCQCDKNGQCPCKVNVQGKRCGRCRNGTYGLQEQNKDGCIPCFCFERSQTCDQAEYKWTQLVAWGDRHLKISYSLPRKEVTEFKPWNTREICYLNLASPERRDIVVGRGTQDLVMVDSLAVIPGVTGDVNLSIGYTFDSPIYWKLPPQFLGDRILSYNGYLRFRVSSHGGNIPFPQNILKTYPLVQMRGNEKVVLEYFPEHTSKDGYYRVRLHEDHWRDKGDPSSPVSRPKFMICLQNVQDILVRASHASDLSRARLNDVSLSTAIPRNTKDPLARGIERCSCSAKYNGTSCQDPSQGYYRYKKPNYLLSPHLIDLVGEATPCQCNGRTNICFKEDGHCIGCDANTIGHNCEFCKAGYYGNPAAGGCRVCQCPTAEYNYAMSCSISYGEMSCACKDGYSGKRCENCAPGYYGNVMKGGCKPCHCERLGSINDFCDAESGQCYCKPGISGRDCTQCAPRHVVSEAGCRSCDEGCSGVLLRDFHYMDHKLKRLNLTDTSAAGWRYLAHIRNQTHHLRTDLTHYTNTKAQLSTLVDDYYFDSSLRRLQGRARQNNLESQTAVINSRTILRQCEELSVTSHNLRRNIEDTVGDLLNYAIGETPSVNIGRALQTAEDIHKELRRRNFDLERANVEEHLRLVQELLDRIRGMGDDSVVIASQRRKLNETERLIRDHQEHLRVVAGDNENTASMLREGAQMLAKARKAEEMLASGKDRILEKITSGEDTLGLAVSHLNDATMLYQDVRDWLYKLDHPMKRMRDRYDLQSEVLSEYENRYITPARHHAESLARRAQNLFDLFNRTRDVADLPLRAAQAYKNIVEALRKARKAAEEASHVADRAYIEVHPFDGRSLIHDSHSSRDQAQQLLDMTVSLRPREASLKNGLQDHQDEFRDLELEVRGIQQSFQQLLNTLEGISTERRNLFPDVMNKISEVVRMIEVERSRYLRIEELIRVVLMIRWQEFRSDFDVDYTSMLKMVINSMMELERAKTISEKLFVRREEILEYSEKVEWKFSNIRKKILKSRHMASTIRVSLAGHQGNCRRSYRVRTQSTTTSSIQIIYSSSSSHDDSLLFYLSSYQNLSDFMAVEMLDRRIRFHWDNGGGTKSITNPTRIDYSDDALLNDDKWYLIRASRIGNIGKLLVHPMRKTEDGEEVEGVSPQGYNILDVPEISQVYVGGVPDDPSPTVLARGFYGCMSQVSLDDQMVSLWNFISNRECSACIEGPAFRVEEYTFTFNGEGYAEIPQDFLYDTEKYGVSFNFKTLDENALLFLAISKDNTQFFSVELRNGQVFFQMFGPKKKVFMITKEKYNTGNWTSLRADWVYFPRREKGALTVENEVYYSDFTDFGPLDLSESSVFFGGVPPDFDSARLPDINMQSFLGCMNTLQIKQVEQNPVSGNYYGVEQGCQPHGLRSVGFSGDGYLEMKSEPLKSKANFGCSFRSSQTDALLLLSTCQRQGDVQNYFSLSLADGRLSVKVSNNDETVSLGSPPGYNDGAFHNIVVMKNEREISLLVDDRKVDSRRSGRDMVINASSHGGLYFGGIPNYLSVRNQVASTESLRGCIRNVVLNDRLFYLDEPVSFSHAGFGRCKQPLRKSVSLEDSLLSDGEPKMCARPSAYEVDGVAVKFGDHPHSYVRIPIKKKGLSNHFNISIDFRTYYPNGMLLLTFEEKNDKVFLLSIALQDGRLTFTLKAKRKLLMKSTAPLNDGKWHNIFIEKRGPKYVLNIDGVKKKNGRGPKKFKSGNGVFVGGLPPEDFDLPAYITEETFKGCIRGLTINGRTFDLSGGHTEVSNVGQCFSNVEPGSYFSGDSYAIYSKQFRIGALLELELQFRTSAMNGILVSVSEPKGYPALGLEITNGAVVMGVNIGNGHVFRANQTFNTPFRVCDNRWHSVKATYVKNSITLRVDQYDEQYGFTDNGELQQSLTNSPLYIGGLPEGANLGVLTVRDNFKGCIRNVVIQNQRKDWTDMEKLNNVKLNSCPAE